MRILLTNDDGINAPGLKSLIKIARQLTSDVWVVAPETEQSGASHSLTLSEPLRVRKISRQKFAVRGTPTDCVMLAMANIMVGKQPDLLLSGVNRGGNLGEDVTYSGTIAAAMEGTLLEIPSIALSQVFEPGGHPHWTTAETHAVPVIKKLIKSGWAKDILINVNFPDRLPTSVKGVEIVTQGRREAKSASIDERTDARNVPYYWIGFRKESNALAANSDLAAVQRGAIAVTPLHLDLTHRSTLKRLKGAFGV